MNQSEGLPPDKATNVYVYQTGPGGSAAPAPPGMGMSTASLVLGIIALVFTASICGIVIAIVLAPIGLILGNYILNSTDINNKYPNLTMLFSA